jgi:hypothetical protein
LAVRLGALEQVALAAMVVRQTIQQAQVAAVQARGQSSRQTSAGLLGPQALGISAYWCQEWDQD